MDRCFADSVGREVLPEFKERDEKIVATKAEEYAPIVDAALSRKERSGERMPDDYVMKAIPKQMVDGADNDQGKQWMRKLADDSATGNRDEDLDRTILGR